MPLHIACVLRACEIYALQAAVDDLLRDLVVEEVLVCALWPSSAHVCTHLLRDLVVEEVQMPLRCRHICNIHAL